MTESGWCYRCPACGQLWGWLEPPADRACTECGADVALIQARDWPEVEAALRVGGYEAALASSRQLARGAVDLRRLRRRR